MISPHASVWTVLQFIVDCLGLLSLIWSLPRAFGYRWQSPLFIERGDSQTHSDECDPSNCDISGHEYTTCRRLYERRAVLDSGLMSASVQLECRNYHVITLRPQMYVGDRYGSHAMNLYIWVNPYRVEFGSSLLVVSAASLDEARQLAISGKAYAYGSYERSVPSVALGEPSRIVPSPCAEWHEWSV